MLWSNEFATKVLNQFELNDIDCTQPKFGITSSRHYFKDVNTSTVSKYNNYVSESSGKLPKTRAVTNAFSVMHHNIRGVAANDILMS